MSKASRDKGASGEREFCKILSAELGRDITRNITQDRDGGDDILCLEGWAIEVRRRERLSLDAWWKDVCSRGHPPHCFPALAYRQNRQPWRIVVPLRYFRPKLETDEPVTLTLGGFVQVVKEAV